MAKDEVVDVGLVEVEPPADSHGLIGVTEPL